MARNRGWVPKQHGAWAMVVVPYLVGLALAARVRALTAADWLLGLTWLVGYFAFSAASLLVKARRGRRGVFLGPLLSYGLVCAATGTAALLLGGWHLLTWVPLYAIALPWCLWLVAHRKERSVLSGVLTVVASCALMLVLRFDTPAELVRGSGSAAQDLSVIFLVTGYFVGTVLHIKAIIRERGSVWAHRRSIIHHTGLVAFGVAALSAGSIGWPWLLWLVALLARAIWLPGFVEVRKLRPLYPGLVEIVFSLGALSATWVTI